MIQVVVDGMHNLFLGLVHDDVREMMGVEAKKVSNRKKRSKTRRDSGSSDEDRMLKKLMREKKGRLQSLCQEKKISFQTKENKQSLANKLIGHVSLRSLRASKNI